MDREARIKLLTAALCVIVFGITLEILARTEDSIRWGAGFLDPYSSDILRKIHPDGHLACRPMAKFEKWELDEFGFRVIQDNESLTEPAVTVGVLGTSETFGLQESPGNEWPAVLQRELNGQSECRIKVLNAACPGHSLLDMRAVFDRVQSFDASSIVVIYPTPHLYLDEFAPGLHDSGRDLHSNFEMRIVRKGKDLSKRFLPMAVQIWLRERALERKAVRDKETEWSSAPTARVELFHEHLRSLLRRATDGSRSVFVATHATRFQEEQKSRDDYLAELGWRRFYPHASLEGLLDMDAEANRLIRNAAEHDNGLIDMDAQVTGHEELFSDFTHFSDFGAKRVAEIIAQHILVDVQAACQELPES